MYIHEALAAIDDDHPYITRRRWQEPDSWGPNAPQMFVTHPHKGLAIKSPLRQVKELRFGWTPAVKDLIADDWIPVS